MINEIVLSGVKQGSSKKTDRDMTNLLKICHDMNKGTVVHTHTTREVAKLPMNGHQVDGHKHAMRWEPKTRAVAFRIRDQRFG